MGRSVAEEPAARAPGPGRSSAGPVRIGILTVSDGVHAGRREDRSGQILAEWAARQGFETAARAVVPDEATEIVRVLLEWCDERDCDLVVSTGGTGLAARDVTPEATQAAIDRAAPGIAESLRARGLRQTPLAALSRGVAGVRGTSLIVNLPGHPAAVEDSLDLLRDLVPHAVALLRGRTEHD